MESFKALQDSISAALVSTTRSATQLSGADLEFQRSFDPALGAALDAQNARLLQLAQRLVANAAASSDAVGPKLPDVEAIDGNWRGVVDVIDSLLEKADTSLDEYSGVVKRIVPGAGQVAAAPKPRFANTPKTLPKPQLLFEHAPNNHESGGFRPLLTSKPHAKVPLEECLKTFRDKDDQEQYPHPYQTEIDTYEYPPSMHEEVDPQPPTPLEASTATFVDTPEELALMLAELKTAKEIAIDLEHHDNRTYIGIVSLMQISTRERDWIVDTLKPWRRKLECLNEVFADPNILKVLHGSYMDIVWLQRDLGLYIVGLFDTYHAARSLGYPGGSLAFLLEKFVKFKAQKQYQMADWRIRPLSEELFNYARADTHFLLYIFDNMRNELIEKSDFTNPEKNKLRDVLLKSRDTALQRYEHPVYDTELGLGSAGWYRMVSRTPVQYTPQQFAVFRAVHKWRDDVAREEDESTIFIMPHHAIFSIARSMPEDKAALFNAVQHVSHFLRVRGDDLIKVIHDAKSVGDDAPDLNQTLQKISDLRFAEKEQSRSLTTATADQNSAPALQIAPFIPSLDTPPLRAPTSGFWGSLWGKEASQQKRLMSTLDVNLAVPLPPLTAEIFADPSSLAETPKTEQAKPTFVPKDERPKEDERSDIFIVKQLGGKRKRGQADVGGEASAPLADQADHIMLDHSEDEKATRRAEKEHRKKEAKLRKQQRRKSQPSDQPPDDGEVLDYGDGGAEDEQPFDYASAPSVLRAQEATRDREKGSGKKKKDKKKPQGFNPYAKLTDAPRGLPRANKETAGRSKTFSS
ncbi:hypothetical protein K491DRAFT_697037 [Lophiostoma macrostomum CBS 122681]|uniref:HRDC domain-containing protein n=1 Tax=Lophiostoma macrostomum CBS 122681 TaxID=1314788 RepID=A0A6A6SVZ1_9PLEO|nr:hypothetical protein K491DRAFT_697037 [Lophiostoma macrostomum CBS 122681]